jgi:hypothetical protein
MPSAYLNALHEEGTREDLLREIGKLYDGNVRLRAALIAARKHIDPDEQPYLAREIALLLDFNGAHEQ